MAFRGDSPEEYPVIRAPPMNSGHPPPTRPPPWERHRDDRPTDLESPPPTGFPPGGVRQPVFTNSEDVPRRFASDSPPQRHVEAFPPGHHDSTPRTFPGRINPPREYLSPEDSPPYRYMEDPPRRYNGGRSPYSEDAALPMDIDGPPPGFQDEGRRRFGGSDQYGRHSGGASRDGILHTLSWPGSESPSPPRGFPGYNHQGFDGNLSGEHPGYRDERLHTFAGSESPSPPPGFRDDGGRRFNGNISGGYPGYRDERLHTFADSESPSPPPGYSPSPPHGRYLDEPPRRFGTSPRQLTAYADDESRPQYADEGPRRIGQGGRRVLHDGSRSPPGPDELSRRIEALREFHDGSSSPPGLGYADESSDRFGGPPPLEFYPGSRSPPGPEFSNGSRPPLGPEFYNPSRSPPGLEFYDGTRSPPEPIARYAAEPPRRFGGTPPRELYHGPPPGSADEPPGKLSSPRQFADGPLSSEAPRGYDTEAPARKFSSTPGQRLVGPPSGLPPLEIPDVYPPGSAGYAEGPSPVRIAGATPLQLSGASLPDPLKDTDDPPELSLLQVHPMLGTLEENLFHFKLRMALILLFMEVLVVLYLLAPLHLFTVEVDLSLLMMLVVAILLT